ncbi:MAG: thiamine-phosphate kinase [Bryobacteraceae bacterium]
MNELALVEMLRKMAERSMPARSAGSAGLILGIGDDCAIFRPRPGVDLLFKSDQAMEDVHFLRTQPAHLTGQRALARALSDIASMGGDPLVCLVSLSIPKTLADRWIRHFYKGLLSIAKSTGTALCGGDLGHSEKIYCDITLCGSVPRGKALRRGGAIIGDAIYVSGPLGKPWDQPITPRLELGKKLRGKATSCMDISDGIALDLHRLTKASSVAAELDSVPVHNGATLERALHGGEDYELLFTMPANRRAPTGTIRVGAIVKGKPGTVRFQGKPLPARGYEHFH